MNSKHKNLTYCFILILFSTQLIQPEDESLSKKENLPEKEYEAAYDHDIYTWSKPMTEAFSLVKTKYYQQIDVPKAMVQTINSFVERDPHSKLLDPKSYKEIVQTTQGEFYGIGIIIDNLKKPDDEFLRVIDTIPSGPADTAGILPDDKIVQVGDVVLKGMSVEEVVAKIKGKRNTKVHIKVLRKGSSGLLEFDITRDKVKQQHAVCYHFKDHNVFYLALNMFTESSLNQLSTLLQKSQQQHSNGLILDLRNNSGGLLTSVIDIAGLFLPKNSLVVVTKDRNGNVTGKYSTNGNQIKQNTIPIFILVNNYTASAAEILAGCLQIHANKSSNNMLVFVVGTKTFGKGSVQEVIPISNDCALKLTTALYYLPDDTSIQGIGIEPDITIEQRIPPSKEASWFKKYFGRESSLKNSIKPKNTKKDGKPAENQPKEKKSWQERKKELISKDFQILNTVQLIHMLNLGIQAEGKKLKTRKNYVDFLNKKFDSISPDDIQEIKV